MTPARHARTCLTTGSVGHAPKPPPVACGIQHGCSSERPPLPDLRGGPGSRPLQCLASPAGRQKQNCSWQGWVPRRRCSCRRVRGPSVDLHRTRPTDDSTADSPFQDDSRLRQISLGEAPGIHIVLGSHWPVRQARKRNPTSDASVQPRGGEPPFHPAGSHHPDSAWMTLAWRRANEGLKHLAWPCLCAYGDMRLSLGTVS